MSTPSMVLLCAGAAASLAGVWSLAGLSERSSLRVNGRVLIAGGLGAFQVGRVYMRGPVAWRGELLLPVLFAAAAVLATVIGAAKLDAALADKDGPRAVRRAAGLLAGTAFSMAAVAASSLELLSSSLIAARFGWSCMIGVVAATLIVFLQRARLAGAGAIALGQRGLAFTAVGVFAVLLARYGIRTEPPAAKEVARPDVVTSAAAVPAAPAVSSLPVPSAPPEASAAPAGSASAAPSAATAASSAAPEPAPPAGAPGELTIETVVSKGLLEADARGGVQRRIDKLQTCLKDPKNQQSGTLTMRIGIDASGSVGFVRTTGGDLMGTPLAACVLPAFYKMGFAAPASNSAYFEITLRAPPR